MKKFIKLSVFSFASFLIISCNLLGLNSSSNNYETPSTEDIEIAKTLENNTYEYWAKNNCQSMISFSSYGDGDKSLKATIDNKDYDYILAERKIKIGNSKNTLTVKDEKTINYNNTSYEIMTEELRIAYKLLGNTYKTDFGISTLSDQTIVFNKFSEDKEQISVNYGTDDWSYNVLEKILYYQESKSRNVVLSNDETYRRLSLVDNSGNQYGNQYSDFYKQ